MTAPYMKLSPGARCHAFAADSGSQWIFFDPLGRRRRSYFSNRGEMVATRDALAGFATMQPDALERVTLSTQHVDSFDIATVTTDPEFDANGNRNSIVDPRGFEYTFAHDQANRMISVELPGILA